MNRFKLPLGISLYLAPIFLFSQISGSSGNLLRWEVYKNYTSSDSTAFQRTLYDYPLPKQRIETTYQFEAGMWVEQTRISYTQDALGRTLETILERYDANTRLFIPQARIQNFPRGSSATQTDSVFTYNWSLAQNAWERFIVQRNRFNAQNQQIEGETEVSIPGQKFINRDVNFYDAQGNLLRIEKYALVNGQLTRTSFTLQRFEAGLLSNVTTYAPVPPNDSVPLSRTLTTYTVDKLLNTVEIANWDLVNKVWTTTNRTRYSYTPEQQIQSISTTIITNTGQQNTRSDYVYSANGNILREQVYLGSGEPPEWTLDSKKFYFYDLASSLKDLASTVQTLQISPNPSREEVRLNLPSGVYFQVFNSAGQIQASGKINGQNLDIRQWPNGLYWLVAQDKQLRWYGKILKE